MSVEFKNIFVLIFFVFKIFLKEWDEFFEWLLFSQCVYVQAESNKKSSNKWKKKTFLSVGITTKLSNGVVAKVLAQKYGVAINGIKKSNPKFKVFCA